MVFGLILGGAKALLGGRKKKGAPQAAAGPNPGDRLKADASRTAKELLTPMRKNGKRKPTRNGSRSRGRSGGR